MQKEKKRSSNKSYYVVDRLNKSVLYIHGKSAVNTVRHPRKKWYNRKTPRGAKVVKTFVNYLNETKGQNEDLFFITLTTVQHKTGHSDTELWRRVGYWLQKHKLPYVCTVERQTESGYWIYTGRDPNSKQSSINLRPPTEDLHFHIIIRSGSSFDITKELQSLSRRLGVKRHPSLFDVKRISELGGAIHYITKYIGKGTPKCSSLFACRTFSVSNSLRRSYKANAHEYVRRVEGDTECINFLISLPGKKLKLLHKTDFFGSFEYKDYIWPIAVINSTYERVKNREAEN